MSCPTWAREAQTFVRANEPVFSVLQPISIAVGGVFPPAYAFGVAVNALRNDCNGADMLRSACKDAVFACDVISVACIIAGVAASLGLVTIPVGISLGAIAAAAQALRVVFLALSEGRAPRLSDALGAFGPLLGFSSSQTQEAAKLVRKVPASEISMATTATQIQLKRYPFVLRRATMLRRVIAGANANVNADVRDIVLSELAVLKQADEKLIRDVLAQQAIIPRLKRDNVRMNISGRRDVPAAEVLEGYIAEAKEAAAWFVALGNVSRQSLPWGIDTAKAVILDPSKAPGPDFGGRNPVGGGGASGSSLLLLGGGAIVVAKILKVF